MDEQIFEITAEYIFKFIMVVALIMINYKKMDSPATAGDIYITGLWIVIYLGY